MASENKIILYHGSKSGITGDIKPSSREFCDFGKGFYMGTDEEQVKELVCTRSSHKIYKIEFDISDLKILNIPLGYDWSYVVAYNRGFIEKKRETKFYEKYSNFLNVYDVVIGEIANDKIFTSVNAFMANAETDEVLFRSLSLMKLGIQYVCKTQKACNQIKIISEYKMTNDEMQRLEIKRQNDLTEMEKNITQVRIKYYREGLLLDEIIDNFEKNQNNANLKKFSRGK